LEPLVDLSPAAAWRRIPVPTAADVVPGGKNLLDLAGSYLCKVALVSLNKNHLSADPVPVDLAVVIAFMESVAVECLEFSDDAPGAAHVAKKLKLDGDKLLDGIPSKALWVIKKWDPEKISGRQRGGRHGAAQGVRKGPRPRLIPGLLADYADLDPGERKRMFQSDFPCSDSTYFKLQKAWRARQTLNAQQAEEAAEFAAYLDSLLPH
jgi:hypothetical protein